MTIKYSIIMATVIATGCSSGGDSSEQSSTGVFLDSAVSGIKYKTETKNGETNAAGEFSFLPGENVTFSIGDVDLPATPAGTTITPLDIFNAQSINDTSVVNAARLLQTLDEDGDPANGISITAEAHTSATGLTLDFSSSTFDTDVTNLVANSGSVTTSLIDEATAVSHLQDTLDGLIIGSWYIPSDNKTLITFIDETNYYVTQEIGAEEPLCSHGMESGTYTWNSVTGTFNLTNVIDTTGDCGLTSSQGETYTASLEISDNTLIGTDTEGTTQLSKVVDAANPIVGSWYIDESNIGENKTLVTFIDDSNYFVTQEVDPDELTATLPSFHGMEVGTYTYDSVTGDIVFTNVIDTTGDSGFTSIQGEIWDNVTVNIINNQLMFTFVGGSFSLDAIK